MYMANESSELWEDDGDLEPCSTLSYECVDDMTLPAIDRGGTKYIALQMARTGLLSKYADSVVPPLAAQYKWRIRRMTSAEANLLNAAKKDCPGECCRTPFAVDGILVDLPSFLRFYGIVRDCVMLTTLHPAALRDGGWLQVNNAVCPYVWRSCIRYVPLVIINLAAEVCIGGADGETRETNGSSVRQPMLVRVTSSELTFLNEMCTRANQNFRFDANTDLVSLIDVKLASDAIIFDLPPSSDPFDYALFLGRMDAETVAAGKLAIKAGWDKFHKFQKARKSPAPSESSATSERVQVEEPVFVDDSDSPEVIVLSPAAADSEPPDEPSSPAARSPRTGSSSPSSAAKAAGSEADGSEADQGPTRDTSVLASLLDDPRATGTSAREAAAAASIAAARAAAAHSGLSAADTSQPRGVSATAGTASAAYMLRAMVGAHAGASGSAYHGGRPDGAASVPKYIDAAAVVTARASPAAAAAVATAAAAASAVGTAVATAADVCASPGAVSADSAATAATASPCGSQTASLGSPDVCAARGAFAALSPSPDSGFLSPLPSPTDQKGAAALELLQNGGGAHQPSTLLPSPVPVLQSPPPPDASVERLVAQYAVLEPIVRERRAQGLGCDGEVLRLLVWFVHIQQQLFNLLHQQLQIVRRLRGHDRVLVGECELIVSDMLSNTKFWLSRRHDLSPRTRTVLHHTLTCAVLQRRVQSHLNYLVGGLFCVDTPAAFENFTFLRNLVALALITQGARHAHAQQPMTAYTIVERCKVHLLRHVTAWSLVKPSGGLAFCRDNLQTWWSSLASVYAQVYKYADEKAAAAAAAYSLESDMLLQQQQQQLPTRLQQQQPATAAAAGAGARPTPAAATATAAVRATAWWPQPEAPTPAGFVAPGCSEGYKAALSLPPGIPPTAAGGSGRHLEEAMTAAAAAAEALAAAAVLTAKTAAVPADGNWAKRRAMSGPPGASATAGADLEWLSTARLLDASSGGRRKTPQAASGSPLPVLESLPPVQASAAGGAGLSVPPSIASPAAETASSCSGRPAHTVHYAALGPQGVGDGGGRGGGDRHRVAGSPTAVFCVHPLNGTPTPCIARGPDKEWWVLVGDAARALFPSCTVDEFQLVLEEVLRLPLVIATVDDLHVLSMARSASMKPGASASEFARGDGYDGCPLLVRCRSLVEHASQLRAYLNPGASGV